MPPLALLAITCSASSSTLSCSACATCCSRATIACGPMRRKSKRCSRDRIGAAVFAIFWGSVVANTNTTRLGGSSRILSSAFHASRVSMWASSTMYTLCRPSADAAYMARSRRSRASSTPRFDAASSATTSRFAAPGQSGTQEKRAAYGEPSGACDSCVRIWAGAANLDAVELDAASNRGVDDARDLRERAMYAASAEGRHKVYIVDEAHMLTREAWNALLKILEEPPPRVVFVFATTEPQKIAQSAAPILSRLQRFDFRRIGPHAIAERLRHVAAAEGLAADDEALHLIAKSADGGMRDGLSILDQVVSFGEGPVTAARVREVLGLISDDVYGELLRLVSEREPKAVFPLVERLVDAGADLGEFVAGAGEIVRAVLLANLGGKPEGFTDALLALIERYRSQLPAPDLVRLLAVLG